MLPNIDIPDDVLIERQPSRNYAIDWKTGRISGFVDGRKAIEQFILKTLQTARYRHPIYSDDEGCEVEDLIGKQYPWGLFKSECERTIKEALLADDRISDVYDFAFKQENESVYVDFTCDTAEGVIPISEKIS